MSFGGQQSTSKEELPPYVQDAQKALISTGQNLTGPFTGNAPAFATAGFTPDQIAGFDLTRNVVQGAFTQPNMGMGFLGGITASPTTLPGPATIPPPAQAQAFAAGVNQAGAASAGERFNAGTAAQLGGNEFQQFLNPYTNSVVNSTLDTMRRERARTAADIGARAAASGSFGGSREAVQRSMLDRNFGDQVASTVAGLQAQGFDRASTLAGQNAAMRQQMGLANTQLDNSLRFGQSALNAQLANQVGLANAASANQIGLANAGAANQVGLANANAQNAAASQNAQLAQQAGLSNMQALNDAANRNADRSLQAATVGNGLTNDEQMRQLRALQALAQGGQQQQQLAQANVDTPFTMLQRLIGTTPSLNNTGKTTTTETSGGNPLQAILGLGSLFLSDENDKKDIKKLGNDPQTGLPLYSYNYKDDPKSAPKRVGPMAQDIEKVNPGAVMKVGGKKVVRG